MGSLKRRGPRALGGVILGLMIAAVGCARNVASLDQRDERDPLLRRARDRKKRQDVDGAIEWYQRALERKPGLARAHLEVGLLYDTQKQDYLRALYHYQRYLEMRPKTEKRPVIEQLIQGARVRFASTLPAQPSGAIEEITLLRREVESLRARLAATGDAPAKTGAAPAAVSSTKLRPPQPAPAQPAVSIYVVESGDTLSRIAGKVYGDSGKWSVIYEANRSMLKGPESVRVGQTLIIPRLDSESKPPPP